MGGLRPMHAARHPVPTPRRRWAPRIPAAPVLLVALVAPTATPAGEGDAIPPPSATPARLVVSGRTSTALEIAVVAVGQNVPRTHAGERIGNSEGFEWYVSQHYALKSELGPDHARMVLETSELALPHLVALTGLEPPDADSTRMAIVYAKSLESMRRAIVDDLGGPWNGHGGGVTLWANLTAYNYPSGTLRYHQRDLVIHENLHMLLGVATREGMPRHTMGEESFVYAAAQHAYDPAHKRLTLAVFDQAPINHPTAEGVLALQESCLPIEELITRHWNQGGPLGATYTHFLWSDPDRWFRWCLWRDAYYAGEVVDGETNRALMERLFGPLERFDRVWRSWIEARRVSYRHVDWGWEQDGDELMAYGWPWDPAYWSQMDLRHAPGEPVAHDPLRMDYPAAPMPPSVGPVERGALEPAIGYLADLSGGGWIGLGLGVEGRSMCQVVLERDRLVVVGRDLDLGRREFPLSAELLAAGRENGQRYGVTIRIEASRLAIRVRAGEARALEALVDLEPALRRRLVEGFLAVVAKDGRPRLVPFVDDARRPPPDLLVPAPANFWRFPAEAELLGLYRAAHRLGRRAPGALLALREDLLALVDAEPALQATAPALYRERIAAVASRVRMVGDARATREALGLLVGIPAR